MLAGVAQHQIDGMMWMAEASYVYIMPKSALNLNFPGS